MTNLIDATGLFELKKEAHTKGLKFTAYRDTVEYADELSDELLYTMCDIMQYHGFNLDDKVLADDFAFINMFIQATVDRQLGIENPMIKDMDFCIGEMKDEIVNK